MSWGSLGKAAGKESCEDISSAENRKWACRMLLAVDSSSDQTGIYCWGTDDNEVFVEPTADLRPCPVTLL